MPLDVIKLAQELIRCPSVTPKDEGALQVMVIALEEMGFRCHHLPFGEGEERVLNIFARLGDEGPHICYAGHTDVVPPGPLEKWTYPPFAAEIADGTLYGRGAADMKGSVACFAAAISKYLDKSGQPKNGSISMLITGDEEGMAVNGTVKVLEWMKENGHVPDVCLVGEPSNPAVLGEQIKIGRRGSLNGALRVHGKQGHVAYPELAQNPLPVLIKMTEALSAYEFDQGTEFFPPTNLEITTIDVGNKVENVIPESGFAKFNIRFNDSWSEQSLSARLHEILGDISPEYELTLRCSGESFLSRPCDWTAIVVKAVEERTGRTPALTTGGGTSDARFVAQYCPVLEFGPINATIHQIDENAGLDVLQNVTDIYARILELYFENEA